MRAGAHLQIRPWCPFCGQAVGRPRPPQQRKLGEFSVGNCPCGAVYTCDPTGHNVGAAMVEALVYACNDDWELAWELVPEDDYLTGRIENYDEQSHQVLEQKHLDGRFVRGVLYFVRLHTEIDAVASRQTQTAGKPAEPTPPTAPLTPPAGPKKKARKQEVSRLVEAADIEGLATLAEDDIKTLWFMQRLLYDPDEAGRWRTAYIIGQVCQRLAQRKPGPVSDLLHRLFEASSDSAATNWGLVEAIGSIIAGRADIYGAFTRHLLRYIDHPSTRDQVLWALGTIAETRPDLIRALPFYRLIPLLDWEAPLTRGLTIRLMGRIGAREVAGRLEPLQALATPVTIYEEGAPHQTTISELARQALAIIQAQGETS